MSHDARNAVSHEGPEYHRIGILGGGTAGYLTALSFRAFRPDLSVTLLESSQIPIIGVGEATTTEIVPYLHRVLGLDAATFFREVKPTWKLGIKFDWGHPGTFFNYPFDSGSVLEPLLYEGHFRNVTLGSALMAADRFPLLQTADAEIESHLCRIPFAYHLDNKPFVQYLQRRAAEAGVAHLDTEIVDAELLEDGESIGALIGKDGRRHTFDLYIDCSGFRSFLLEQKSGSRFISYSSSLLTDSAVVASVPHDGHIKPYTTAETMNAGWCWNIPQVHEDHRGYVFSSAFCSVDDAVAEMRAKNPRMGDHWLVRFRSGRHEHFWKGNVVAIGNAYGFVEPLESTAIQVVMHENRLLLSHFPTFKSEVKVKSLLNQRVAAYWDYIRWFLSIHYKYNDRFDSPFWQHCRRETDTSGAQWIVEYYQEAAPLTYKNVPEALARPTFNSFGFDVLLSGQQVPARWLPPRRTRDVHDRQLVEQQRIVEQALPQAQALTLLGEYPELLESYATLADSWVALMARQYEARQHEPGRHEAGRHDQASTGSNGR